MSKCSVTVQYINVPHTEILSQELQAGTEDEQDYDAPEEGNLLYKLYSLQDLLLMVLSSVSLTHTRNVGSSQNQVPLDTSFIDAFHTLKYKTAEHPCVVCFLPK